MTAAREAKLDTLGFQISPTDLLFMIQPNGNFQQGNRRFAYFNLFGIGSFPSGQAASQSSHITVGCPRRQGGRGILGNWGSPQTHIVCQPLSEETGRNRRMDQQTVPNIAKGTTDPGVDCFDQ